MYNTLSSVSGCVYEGVCECVCVCVGMCLVVCVWLCVQVQRLLVSQNSVAFD